MEHESRPALDLGRERTIPELLALALTLFRAHSSLFLTVTLIVVAPVVLVVDGMWGRTLADGGAANRPVASENAFLLLATFVIPALSTGLAATIVRLLARGVVPSVGATLREAGPRIPAALATGALFTLGILGGFLLLIVPGIWLSVRWYFGVQAAVLEQRSPVAALARSAELVQDRWWSTLGALLAGALVFGLTAALVQSLATPIHAGVVYVVLEVLIQTVSVALSALFGTLLFFDRSVRRARSRPPAAA